MIIRAANMDDWASISELSRISGYSDWINDAGIRFLETGHPIVAEDEDVVGFAKVEDAGDDSVWLSALRVHPSHRRKGIGEKITRFGMDFALKSGAKFARMLVEPSNNASISLVKKFGFELVETYNMFTGSFDTSSWQSSDFEEDIYVGAGFTFVRLKNYGLQDIVVKEKEEVVVFEKLLPSNDSFQTIIFRGELQSPRVKTTGLVAVPSKWRDQVSKYLRPLEEFATAGLYEARITT